MNSKVWMIDEPEALASKAEWQAHLDGMRRLNAQQPHPQLQAAIERAEKALSEPENAPSNPLRKAG